MRLEAAKRLLDAWAACAAIREFTAAVDFAGFSASALIRSAVERQFEIVGESLGRAVSLEPDLSESIPEIPKIVGLRNRLIHGYDTVDDQIVWDIVRLKLPELQERLRIELIRAGFPPAGF
jgi:uncharacterized protein with HEPN domain